MSEWLIYLQPPALDDAQDAKSCTNMLNVTIQLHELSQKLFRHYHFPTRCVGLLCCQA